MKLLSLITVVVLMQVSLISQAAEVNGPTVQEQAQIDKTNITSSTATAGINLQTIEIKRVTKTNWGTTIVERKLHLRDGVFSLTLHSTKLYS